MHRALIYLTFLVFAPGPGSSAGSITFLVFPPVNRSNLTDSPWLGEALASSISTQLQAPGIDVIGFEVRNEVLEASGLPPNAILSRASMILAGQLAGADRLVFGYYSGDSQELRVGMQVLDLKSMKLAGEVRASGSVDALPAIENEISWQVLAQTGLNRIYSREEFREKARVIPNSSYSHYIRSFGQAEREGQIQLLLKAVQSYPEFPDAQFRLGRLYYEKGDCQNAVQRLKSSNAAHPSYPEAQFMLGNCYFQQNNPTEAIQAYSAILSTAQTVEVLNNLGIAYLRNGEDSRARAALERARTLAQADPIVVINLAILWHLQGESERASSLLEDSLKSAPSQGLLHHLLGLILVSQGRVEQSGAALAEASRLGIDTDKLRPSDLRNLTQLFTIWRYSE